jgi:hypothetical protein
MIEPRNRLKECVEAAKCAIVCALAALGLMTLLSALFKP